MSTQNEAMPKPVAQPRSRTLPFALALGAVAVLALGGFLLRRAMAATNQIALTSEPKGVTVEQAKASKYRPTRRYVATIEPLVEAKIGPQLVSAYVQTVLVRPGDLVHRGQVLATLDCKSSSAIAKQVGMQAKALEETQAALAKQASRVGSLLEGGFVSPNEVEQRTAESASKQSQLLALRAQMLGSDLQVADCILRAPFNGEIGARFVDPGAFIRPGGFVVTLVDRTTVRVTAEAPESDFGALEPGNVASLHIIATGDDVKAAISRRSPSADMTTRTVHIEIDLPNPGRRIPAGSTADVKVEVGRPQPSVEIPLAAASVRGTKVSVVTVANGVAHKTDAELLGEREGRLYLDPSLGAGAWVVTEGRAAVNEGDRVIVKKGGAVGPELERHHAEVVEHGNDKEGAPDSHSDTRAVRE